MNKIEPIDTYPTMTSFNVDPASTTSATIPTNASSTAMPGNVPAFLVKLWKIVEDENLDNIVSWSTVCLKNFYLLLYYLYCLYKAVVNLEIE